ncbi:septum formation family protein [Leucobacter sp. M11]|uniref:septum formation family protein n=1 Tax=Leucobacter sp. M11 TaxID=2993565 RepID=UPI002D7ED598|nr:septum formation family protein [Leucobacter sp. M11]MEB4615187.1 septum formation family protein [Leucobacter sp. M11]
MLAALVMLGAIGLSGCSTSVAPSAQLSQDLGTSSTADTTLHLPAEQSFEAGTERDSADPNGFPAVSVGDCLQGPTADATSSYLLVPCAEAHQYEVFASRTLGESAFPGETEIDLIATELCERRTADAPQASGDRPAIGVFAPSEQEWLFGDRELVCVWVVEGETAPHSR